MTKRHCLIITSLKLKPIHKITMSHHPQVIDDRAKANFCKSKGSGRYTTDWIPQMSIDNTIHQKTKTQRLELKKIINNN